MFIHTESINYIIKKRGFNSYLEIGVNKRENNFDLIQCQFKIGVDPEPNAKANFLGTSDEFFKQNKQVFGTIFVDGLHHADQVRIDLENSIKYLTEGGVIVIHDTDPKEESYTCVPRNGLRGRWNGDVFKIIPYLKALGLDYRTLDYEANGVTVCKLGGVKETVEPFKDFKDFLSRRSELNLCTKTEFENWI